MVKECNTCHFWNGKKSTHKLANCNHPDAIENRRLGRVVATKAFDDWCAKWESKNKNVVEFGDGISN